MTLAAVAKCLCQLAGYKQSLGSLLAGINDTIEIVCMISALGTGTKLGIDKSPTPLPCKFDAMATMTIEDTTVAIVDFFIIPTYSGRSPNRIADIVVTVCTSMFPKLNVKKSNYFPARKILAY